MALKTRLDESILSIISMPLAWGVRERLGAFQGRHSIYIILVDN